MIITVHGTYQLTVVTPPSPGITSWTVEVEAEAEAKIQCREISVPRQVCH